MGTTLLELTVATMVILLVVVFMTSIWVSHARITGKSRQRTTALIAEFTMEEWAAKGWKAASQDALVPALADGQVSVSTKMGLNPEFIMHPGRSRPSQGPPRRRFAGDRAVSRGAQRLYF